MTQKIKLSAGLLCFSLLAGINSSAAEEVKIPRNTRYLALGDSIAFGYNPLVMPKGDVDDYIGYPEIISLLIHRKVANASCFGESSGSFLMLGAPDVGCQDWRMNLGLPLHVPYTGTQMQYALDYLKVNGKKTDLITIDIGGNDLGVLLAQCKNDFTCAQLGLVAALGAYQQNLRTIFDKIRDAGYTGPIVAFTPYAVNYNDPIEVGGLIALNAALKQVASEPEFDVKVAPVFDAFLAADIPFGNSSCAAGLLVKLPGGTCDIHPSLKGQFLIALTVLSSLGGH